MTNRPLRGPLAERIVKEFWERDGWTVHQAKSTRRRIGPPYCPFCHQPKGPYFSDTNDIWKAVDLLGVHPILGFRFAQVTTISGQSGGLSYGNVYIRKKKLESIPWPKTGDFRVLLYGARNQRIGREAARWFQIWEYFPIDRTWALNPDRLHVSGPVVPGKPTIDVESVASRLDVKSVVP